jgi:hypothetical protein
MAQPNGGQLHPASTGRPARLPAWSSEENGQSAASALAALEKIYGASELVDGSETSESVGAYAGCLASDLMGAVTT